MPSLLRGRVVTPKAVLADGVVEIAAGTIRSVGPVDQFGDAQSLDHLGTLLPGLVDIHCHGGGGNSFTTANSDEAAAAAADHHRRGTTTLLASLVTAPPDAMLAHIAALAPVVDSGAVAGMHLEGPFLAAARCGAQDPRYILDPDPTLAAQLLDAAAGAVRVMTVAPERPGFDSLATLLADRGVIVALGHSDADFALFRSALRGTARLVTHLANGMPPIHHRTAGPVGAALVAAAAGDAVVEVIGDGVHVDAGFVALAFATAGPHVALITDAMAAAGMPDGTYELGPLPVRVTEGVARVPSGAIAGGTSYLLDVVRRTVAEAGVSLLDAVRAASATPARVLGIDDTCGSIAPGRTADLLVVDDDDLRLRRVMRRGEWLH